jgi:hypothetical protein
LYESSPRAGGIFIRRPEFFVHYRIVSSGPCFATGAPASSFLRFPRGWEALFAILGKAVWIFFRFFSAEKSADSSPEVMVVNLLKPKEFSLI